MKTIQVLAPALLLCSTFTAQSGQQATRVADALPLTCQVGDEYLASATQQKYVCIAGNSWVPQQPGAAAAAVVPVPLTVAAVTPTADPDPVLISHLGAATQDATNFVWDSANKRLGLGTNTPADRVDITSGNLRVNPGTRTAEAFNLAGRLGIGIPVPYLTPVTNNSVVAFDLYPKGTPANRSTNTGVAWFDLCSTDVNLTAPSFECLRMGKFQNGDSHVSSVAGGTGVVRNLDLQINGGRVGIGTTAPQALLSVGSSSGFQVNNTGNIIKINNNSVLFPAKNAAGYLFNDGNGNFSYVRAAPSASAAAIVPAAVTAAALPANPAVGTVARVMDGAAISDCKAGTGTVARTCEWNGNSWNFSPVGAYILSSQPGFVPANATSFGAPSIATVALSEGARQYVVAKACQASHLYLNLGEAQPAAGSLTVTLRVSTGGAPPTDTEISAIVPAGAPAGTVVSDTVHTADLAAGDLVSIKLVNAAAAPGNLLTVNVSCAY